MNDDGCLITILAVIFVVVLCVLAHDWGVANKRDEYQRCRSWQRIATDSTVVTLHPECAFWLNPLPAEKP